MRILFCNYEYPPLSGGGGIFNHFLAEELAKKHEITLLTSQCPDLPNEESKNGVRIVRVPSFVNRHSTKSNFPSMLAYLTMGKLKGQKLLNPTNFDIINTHFALPTGPVGDTLSRHLKIPNILTVHGGDVYDPSKFTSPHRHLLLRYWVKRLLQKANVVVGQSRNTIANIQQYYGQDINPVQIPLGIKRPPDHVALRQEYRFGRDDTLLVTVGRMVARKSLDQLISILANLRTENTHLIVIGSGPKQKKLRKIAQELQVYQRIHFMGNVSEEEKFRILRMSDLFVSTSIHEGFGLVFLEAMASGLPVICYDHGGQTDIILDGETGFLIKLNDQQFFIEKCRRLIKDAGLRKKMSKEGLKRVEGFYIDRCAERYEELFQKVLEGSSSGKY